MRQTGDERSYNVFASSDYISSTAEIREYSIFYSYRLVETCTIKARCNCIHCSLYMCFLLAPAAKLLIQLRLLSIDRCQQWVVS